ncbi:serine/threonine-protein kinase TBK1-like [Oscarella lobularis]|uniref:serine/threonine-protein kinase TBK1-like n=1 Tax=Oscarella lobularis TaxID=121494 RepID=UPI003313EDA1
MTSKLYQTEHYIWSTKEIIGHGATSSVYRGRKKMSGENVAVKMFNKAGMNRPKDVQDRELEILQKLKHKNIVEMLEIEKETTTLNYVVIMEICSGGSLFNVIEKPENYYGLEEKEFLRFLSDTVAGMKYLREHDVVHRDLKPGNILRAEKDDGTYTYKLSDFGAARELGPEEQFMSIYGTEEYLDPFMYEQAVLGKKRRQTFDSSVDLWSIGVTLFHTATGKLPFQAHGGRNNREMMHQIVSKKAPEAISGVQRTERPDSVEYSNHLPPTTQLCRALCDDLTLLLRQMLDTKKMKGFQMLFDVCDEIITNTCVVVFSVHDSLSFHVHIRKSATFSEFAAKVFSQTKIDSPNQKFYFDGNPLLPTRSQPLKLVSDLPETTEEKPLIVSGGDHITKDKLFSGHIPKAPDVRAAAADLVGDDQAAKACLAMCNQHRRVASRLSNYCRGIVASFQAISNALRADWAVMEKTIAEAKAVCEPVKTKCRLLLEREESERALLENLFSADGSKTKDVSGAFGYLDSCCNHQKKTSQTITQRFKHTMLGIEERPDQLCTSWKIVCQEKTKEFDTWLSTLQHCVKVVKEIREMFYRERKQGRISYLDEHNHIFEKKRLYDTTKKARAFVLKFVSARETLHEQLSKWIRTIGHQREIMQQVLFDVKKEENEYKQFDEELNKWQDSRKEKIRFLMEQPAQRSLNTMKSGSKYMSEVTLMVGQVHRENEQTLIEANEQLKTLEEELSVKIKQMDSNLDHLSTQNPI